MCSTAVICFLIAATGVTVNSKQASCSIGRPYIATEGGAKYMIVEYLVVWVGYKAPKPFFLCQLVLRGPPRGVHVPLFPSSSLKAFFFSISVFPVP